MLCRNFPPAVILVSVYTVRCKKSDAGNCGESNHTPQEILKAGDTSARLRQKLYSRSASFRARRLESTAKGTAMSSFCTRTLSGLESITGAKFHTARTPPSTSASHTACASPAGTAMMPMRIYMRLQSSCSRSTGNTGFPWMVCPERAGSWSNAATISIPYAAKPW